MGLRHLSSEVAPDAGLHVIYVWRGCSDFQSRYRRDVIGYAFQKYCGDEQGYVNLLRGLLCFGVLTLLQRLALSHRRDQMRKP